MSNPRSCILSVGTAVPENKYSQEIISHFMGEYLQLDETHSRKLSLIYQKSGIENRYSVLHDFYMNGKKAELFSERGANPILTRRLNLFNEKALPLAHAAAEDCLATLKRKERKKILPITHLITVSCTGLAAPGIDVQLMKALQLPIDVNRTSINFMGCYAAFHGLKVGDSICKANTNATVLIVMVELCSLHFQPLFDAENMVVNSLFADGAAALLMTSEKKAKKMCGRKLTVKGFYSEVIHSAEKFMTWNPGDNGFLMGLDVLVPQVVEENFSAVFAKSLKEFGVKKKKIDQWAFHPGGRKILEAIGKATTLVQEDMKHSYRVLRNFGNMSSPTICFVLKSILQGGKKKEKIFAAGLGPGITLETAFFEIDS